MNPEEYGSVKKKANSSFAGPLGQVVPGSAQSIQSRMDFGGGVGQFSATQVRDNNQGQAQVQQFRVELNNSKKKDAVYEEDGQNVNAESSQGRRKANRDNTTETKKSLQKSNSDSSDPQIILQYNSEEEDGHNQADDLDDEDEEEYKQSGNHPLSQKNLNINPPQQLQIDRKLSDHKGKTTDSTSLSQNSQSNQNNGLIQTSVLNQNSGQQKQQQQQKHRIGQKLYMNPEKKIEHEIDEEQEEYNVQASSKIENFIENNTEMSQLHKASNQLDQEINNMNGNNNTNMNSFHTELKQGSSKPAAGYKINSLHSNNHEQYLQISQNKYSQCQNNGKVTFDKKNHGEILFSQNTPQNRLSATEEKYSTEQSDRLNEQQYTSYNTNWNQSISPETKLNRLSQQQMINQKDSFFKEKEIENLESDTNHDNIEYHPKDKQSLIQFDDATSKDNSSYNSNKKQRKQSNNEHLDDHTLQKSGLKQESFDNHFSNSKKDQLFLDSSHQLKEIEDSQLKRIISDNHPKKNLLMKEDISVSIADKDPPNDLGKHIGKEIVVSNIINSNSNQGTLKQMQSERINTKNSSQSKLQPILNKLELEKKKERKIQKFCQKFFKDLLKNRSGVPTLTQNNRKMNLDSETPNPSDDHGYKPQNSAKEGLLNEELRKELFNIEEHQKYRLVMDQFLKKFNKSPKDAIQFLIEKQLCDDSEEDIAYMLLTTEGLNKEQLGQFFGSNKERNQSILEAFCSLMDFRNLIFAEAIRLFLSRFRLPGEAQQIDRIVQKFTKVFTNDNPLIFNDEDTPYILCYSAIMLNVDAHSEKIEKNKKMQKSTFVTNNLLCTKNAVSKEFLEQLYDNIVKEKFETKVDYIEKIYSRVPIESMNKQFDGQNRIRIIKELQVGSNLLKYGRQGKPHMRKIRLNEARDKIVWNEIDVQVQQLFLQNQRLKPAAVKASVPVKDKSKKERHICIKDITDLTLGCNATEIMKKHNIPPEFDQFCFSIITSNRTFDLKSNDMETKFKWIAFVYNHLNDQRLLRKNKTTFTAEQKNVNQERINEIWRLDIFSKWDDHWDYAASKPKHILKYETKAQKSGFFSQICSCLSISKSQNSNLTKINHNQSNPNQIQSGSKREYEELELAHQSNKSLLLISLWKFGMPKWVRKTIWPLTIGNRLEITENLYKILLKQVQVSESNSSIANNSISNYNNFDN